MRLLSKGHDQYAEGRKKGYHLIDGTVECHFAHMRAWASIHAKEASLATPPSRKTATVAMFNNLRLVINVRRHTLAAADLVQHRLKPS